MTGPSGAPFPARLFHAPNAVRPNRVSGTAGRRHDNRPDKKNP